MAHKNEKPTDMLGLAPYGEAINTATKGVIDGAGAFLSRICLPAAEEFGLLLKDKVCHWRARNAIAITVQAEKKLNVFDPEKKLHAHPRLVMKAIEEGSWSDNELIQGMWAGLLATSCSDDGQDDTNLIFINILSQLTKTQAIILDYACNNCDKRTDIAGLLYSNQITLDLEQLEKITGVNDLHRLDRELDHLRSLELLVPGAGGFSPGTTTANIQPSTIALQMFLRCQGYNGKPEEFFKIHKDPEPQDR